MVALLHLRNAHVTVDLNNLISKIDKQVLVDLEGKRSLTGVIPVTTNIRLSIAEIALEKSRSAILATAIATYLSRNEDSHHLEIEAKAAIAGMEPEEFLAQTIKEKIRKSDGRENTTA